MHATRRAPRNLGLLPLLVHLLARPASGWISTSQANYGLQIEDVVKASYGLYQGSAFRALGWLWSFPRDPLDTTGLGGGITWALDPALCEHLLPRMRENFWMQTFVGCAMIKASIQRAFDAWAINHAWISFVDVSPLCDEEAAQGGGRLASMGPPASDNAYASPLRTSCSHSEVYVTARADESEPFSDGYDESRGDAVAESFAYPRLTSSFRHTNGETPFIILGENEFTRQMVEVTGGRIELDASARACYYLDHRFCAPFNAMKRATSPGAVFFGGFVFFFIIWGVPMVLIVLEFVVQMGLRIRKRWLDRIAAKVNEMLAENSLKLMDIFREWDEDGSGSVDKEEFRKAVAALGYKAPKRYIYGVFEALDVSGDGFVEFDELQAGLEALKGKRSKTLEGNVYSYVLLGAIAAWSVAGTALRIFWSIVPWAFYQFILQNCWECHDFEAAVAHQMGHLLGLSHPDVPGDDRLGTPGKNSYNAYLAGGGVMNATNASSHCTKVWEDVKQGTPPGLTGSELIYTEGGKCDPGPCGLVRTALMARFTASHSTSGGCLAQDDYEGLLTLYPVCTSGGVPSAPMCHDTPINIGLLLVLTGLLAPLLLSMAAAFLVQMIADHRANVRALREQAEAKASSSFNALAGAPASSSYPALLTDSSGVVGVSGGGGGLTCGCGDGVGGGGGREVAISRGSGSRASRFIALAKKTQGMSPAGEDTSTAPPEAEEAAGAVPSSGRALLPARAQRYAAPPEQGSEQV